MTLFYEAHTGQLRRNGVRIGLVGSRNLVIERGAVFVRRTSSWEISDL